MVPACSLPSAGCEEEEEEEEKVGDKEAVWHVGIAAQCARGLRPAHFSCLLALGQVSAAGMCGWLCWTAWLRAARCAPPATQGPCKPCAHCGFLRCPRPSVAAPEGDLDRISWPAPAIAEAGEALRRTREPLAWLMLRSSPSLDQIVLPGCYELLNRCCSAPSEGCISLGEEMNPFNSGHNL